MGNTSSYRAASSPAASASSATAMVESPSKTRPTSISARSDAETQSASPATAMVESPSKTRPTPISGGSSPRHSFFPRTDAEARSSPRRVIVGTPSARGLEADAEQRPPSPTGYKLKRVTLALMIGFKSTSYLGERVKFWIWKWGEAGENLSILDIDEEFLAKTCPMAFKKEGLEKVCAIPDGKDFLIHTPRQNTLFTRACYSDKMHARA
ncbi:hypothetical protein THAOC_11828, partial [Thalassiosira oceanica]